MIDIPSVIEAALFPRLIGWGRTAWLLYRGDAIDAKTACEWGLVEKVVWALRDDEKISLEEEVEALRRAQQSERAGRQEVPVASAAVSSSAKNSRR